MKELFFMQDEAEKELSRLKPNKSINFSLWSGGPFSSLRRYISELNKKVLESVIPVEELELIRRSMTLEKLLDYGPYKATILTSDGREGIYKEEITEYKGSQLCVGLMTKGKDTTVESLLIVEAIVKLEDIEKLPRPKHNFIIETVQFELPENLENILDKPYDITENILVWLKKPSVKNGETMAYHYNKETIKTEGNEITFKGILNAFYNPATGKRVQISDVLILNGILSSDDIKKALSQYQKNGFDDIARLELTPSFPNYQPNFPLESDEHILWIPYSQLTGPTLRYGSRYGLFYDREKPEFVFESKRLMDEKQPRELQQIKKYYSKQFKPK